ncbi:MAG: GrpB family protein, partial [Calditrichaeota bacterium]|nr:GrpB family protein [Calditrichota bacterium]
METFEEKLSRVLKEEVSVVPYDPVWKEVFHKERLHLVACLGEYLTGRIEHFGSTAVPGLHAKPIVDMLVEVKSVNQAGTEIARVLEAQGYDYFWRPSWGDDTPPFYPWFIKRNH